MSTPGEKIWCSGEASKLKLRGGANKRDRLNTHSGQLYWELPVANGSRITGSINGCKNKLTTVFQFIADHIDCIMMFSTTAVVRKRAYLVFLFNRFQIKGARVDAVYTENDELVFCHTKRQNFAVLQSSPIRVRAGAERRACMLTNKAPIKAY